MRRSRTGLLLGVVIAGGLASGVGVAAAASGHDGDEASITGPALAAASQAALARTGGGRVTDTEVGDEDALYEVEVTLDGGGVVDVHLDRDFTVVGIETDGPEAGDRP